MSALQSRIRRVLLAMDGVVEAENVFGQGTAYWVNGKQVAHFIDDTTMELRLTRAAIRERRAELKADARMELRQGASDWVKIALAKAADVALVAELAELAVGAHRAARGAPSKPPPVGADLERRRRFH